MSLPTFLSWLKENSGRNRHGPLRPKPRWRPATPRRAFRLRLEALEDRALPSTFSVTNLADSGPGSLPQAILSANAQAGSDVIDFASGLAGTITLTSGPLNITDGLMVTGPGAAQLAVSGNDASQVFLINSGVSAVLDGLSITHGQAPDGGGIANGGTLTVSHCTLSANQALGSEGGDARGGAIFNAPGAFLDVSDDTLSNNQAVGGDGGPGHRGGVGRGGGI